ncbi:MAG TPA: hypothetical protein ENH31_05445, partial [Nitrospirae bacterium]|nr:hypothetical protein [Nitrospirota bacterium]
MRYTILAVLSIVFMLSAVPAYAHRGSDVDISIISDNGKEFLAIPFREHRKGRTHVVKKYLEAVKGDNYSIVIRNRTSYRIGVVIAVDGRNIISGKKSYLKSSERMYIVGPHGRTRLEGWRTDLDTVHRFYFTDKGDSYSIRTFNDSSAMGVITVAAFREKKRPEILSDGYTFKESKRRAPAAPSAGEKSSKYEEDTA